MAKISIKKLKVIGNAKLNAVSWQVSSDPNFATIIDESIEDHENLTEWVTELPKSNGGVYGDLESVYARVKLHYDNQETDWIVLNMCSQTNQPVKTIQYA